MEGGGCKTAVEWTRKDLMVHTVRSTRNYSGLESLDKVFDQNNRLPKFHRDKL